MSTHEMGCSSGVGQRCTCRAIIGAEQRGIAYAGLYVDGRCRICAAPAYQESAAFHAEKHLAEGTAVYQYDYRHTPPVQRVLATAEVPTTDADGIGLWERDRTDANTQNLRDAYAKARDLNNATRARIAKAAREAK